MAEHLIVSPTHGQLRVVTAEGIWSHDRRWRAVLDPRPPRLAHLVAVDGESEGAVLELMAATVEEYDATGLVPRRQAWDPQRS